MEKTNPMKSILLALLAAVALFIVACSEDSSDVASLERAGDTAKPTTTIEAADSVSDVEAAMMALTQCLRDEGFELKDPVVDSEGNVQKPEPVEGTSMDMKELSAAWQVCEEHLEGVTFGKESVDVSEQVDQLVELATCMREKGFDVDDPTAETLDAWWGEIKEGLDWKDPAVQTAYEECTNSDGSATGGGK
jgi:hypothetical protein